MAGIGFVLRKLAKQDNLLGLFQAYTFSALASTGPWLFTVLALGLLVGVGQSFLVFDEMFSFKLIITYNFALTLVLSGPIVIISTRFIADMLYTKQSEFVPGMFISMLTFNYLIQLPVAFYIYIVYADMPVEMGIAAIANFMVIAGVWLVTAFSTALKDYKTTTLSFAVGLVLSFVFSLLLGDYYSTTGLLWGFTIGMSYILATMLAKVFVEYPFDFSAPLKVFSYFFKYWALALSGLIYNLAIWIDKWLMWLAPNAEKHEYGFYTNPNYDSAMFLAYLTIVPALAIFVFKVETGFYEKYMSFCKDLNDKATYRQITDKHKDIVATLIDSLKTFMIVQCWICFISIIMAPQLIEYLKIPSMQISIFRYGVLGVLYQMFMIFQIVLLSYFDDRKGMLLFQMLFLVANTLFTYLSISCGFEYYGAGYFLASMLTCFLCSIYTAKYVRNLPFHVMVSNNIK
jgi:uncharacterized membrane protein